MDANFILMYVVQALGGLAGGNILGALTRGGGGVVGRSIFGLVGGLGAGWAAANVEFVSEMAANWQNLLAGAPGAHLANFITGAIGGGLLGLIGGIVVRPRG
ncbi:MAG: hypothetical protein JNJ73_02820 [Hyphomonadaceae bacterium]|nr:hypothetical protein [Hyphomonadaceae bacterium]